MPNYFCINQTYIIAGYFEDDASDELTNDPVFKSVLEKDALASQPTVSRIFYSGSVVKTKIQAFYNELIYVTR